MTREETAKVLDVLLTAYPHAFKNSDKTKVLTLWARMFQEETFQEVSNAIGVLIATRVEGYSPTIGEVKAKIRAIRTADELTENEAWALVAKACRNGYYGYMEEYAKLPPAVQKAVGKPTQLREWSQVDTDTFQSVIASNFMRSYKTISNRERELEMLPPDMRDAIGELANKMAFPEIEGGK